MDSKEIVEKVREAGVVGCGGAGFPTHVKINARADVVIANGASCEPLLDSDIHLMEHEAAKVLGGLKAVMSSVGARRGVVAVKRKHIQALAALKAGLDNSLEIFELNDFYPAGDEQILVLEITGKVVPEGGIPLNVGAVVDNVETLYNISGALENEPVTMRFLTVAGEVENPCVLLAPIGTPMRLLLEKAGGASLLSPGFIEGGPMMGKPIDIDREVVKKTTTGLIALPWDHVILQRRLVPIEAITRRAMSACTQCSYCTDLCPRFLIGHRLRPNLTMRSVAYGRTDPDGPAVEALICSECGVCETSACNMGLSPLRVNQMLKKKFGEMGVKFPRTQGELKPNPNRAYRLAPIRTLMQRAGLMKWYGQRTEYLGEVQARSVEIPLRQHLGVPCEPLVKPGDRVQKGQKIGDAPQGKMGAPIHASISGEVSRISDGRIRIEG